MEGKHGAQAVRYQIDQRQIARMFNAEGHLLKLAKLGALKLRWHREVSGTPKMVTIRHDAGGRYFTALSVETEITPLPARTNATGIDYRIKDIAVTSEGWKSENPNRFIAKRGN